VLPLAFEEPEMDLNYLYHRQQVSLFRAGNAGCARARRAHGELAELYGARIEAFRTIVAATVAQ